MGGEEAEGGMPEVDWGRLLDRSRALELLYRLQVCQHSTPKFGVEGMTARYAPMIDFLRCRGI